MQIEMVMTGALQENCYVVMDDTTHDAVVVDPGDDAPRIVEAIERMGGQVGLNPEPNKGSTFWLELRIPNL